MKRYSEEEKAMWIEDWKASGMSATMYARENELNPQSLRNWASGQIEKAGQQNFVEIIPTIQRNINSIPEILIEKGDVRIHIPIVISQSDLRTVIQSLGCEL
jgi:transposase-like protein